jgi:hypothetical protein
VRQFEQSLDIDAVPQFHIVKSRRTGELHVQESEDSGPAHSPEMSPMTGEPSGGGFFTSEAANTAIHAVRLLRYEIRNTFFTG